MNMRWTWLKKKKKPSECGCVAVSFFYLMYFRKDSYNVVCKCFSSFCEHVLAQSITSTATWCTITKSHNVWHNEHTTSHHTSAAYLQLVSYRTLQNVTSESFCTNEEAFPSNPTPGDEQNDKEAPSILFKYQIKHKIKSKEQWVLTWKYSSMAFLT